MFVSAQFRCPNERIVDLAIFEPMFAAAAYACVPLTLMEYYTITTSARVGQERPISTPENLVRLWNRKTTVKLLLASSRRMDDGPYASVGFGRSDRPGGEVPPTAGEVEWLRSVTAEEQANFLLGVKRAFVLANGWSGHLHATTESAFASAELGFTATSRWRPFPEEGYEGSSDAAAIKRWYAWKHPEDTNDRVQMLGPARSRIGPRLRGTYWGTLLGPTLVAELGGLSRITREAPVAVAESLSNGGAYLQLTPTPEPITTDTMQRGLLELERFLEPVLVPTPLYWAQRHTKA